MVHACVIVRRTLRHSILLLYGMLLASSGVTRDSSHRLGRVVRPEWALMTMLIERHRSPMTITTVPRSTLAHTHHREIDAILKDLKFCSRRLKSALDGFKDELRTLERLYYKCKSQHRMALFFKRVLEMRRYGRLLTELDILERVDLLRAAFVGLDRTDEWVTATCLAEVDTERVPPVTRR